LRIKRRSSSTRCCFCHGDLEALTTYRCPGCRATFHEDCRSELARCTTIGCVSPARAWSPSVEPDALALIRIRLGLLVNALFLFAVVVACLAGIYALSANAGTVVTNEDGVPWTIFGADGWFQTLAIVGGLSLCALGSGRALRKNLAIDPAALLERHPTPLLLTRREETDSEGTTTTLELRDPGTGEHVFDMSLLLFAPRLSRESEAAPLAVHVGDGGHAVVAGRRGDLTIASLTSRRAPALSARSPRPPRSQPRRESPTRRARD
jgi:hypothetical protein